MLTQQAVVQVMEFMQASSQDLKKQIESTIPKVKLGQKNISNCQLLLNREQLVATIPPGSVLAEIGVDQGEFSEHLLRKAAPSMLHLIDQWGSDRYGEDKAQHVLSKFSESINAGRVCVTRTSSVAAAARFQDANFDWIYIDTDHSYETTKAELYSWAPKVKSTGVIAGHDYALGNWIVDYRYGVIEAVHEFCVKESWELIYLTAEPTENQSFAIRRIN